MEKKYRYIYIAIVAFSFVSYALFKGTSNIQNSAILGEVTEEIIPSNQPDNTAIESEEYQFKIQEEADKEIDSLQEAVPNPSSEEQTLSSTNLELVSSETGNVATLKYNNIKADTLYKINLSQYSFSSFAISWVKGTSIKWSTKVTVKESDLHPIPIDDDTFDNEPLQFSGLLTAPDNGSFYIIANKDLQVLTISLISPVEDAESGHSTQSTGVYNFNSGASYSSLPIVTRDSWGASTSAWDSNSSEDIDDVSRLIWYPVYYKATRIVVHHTVTAPNGSNPAAAVRGIYLYHTYVRGWGDIGYNFIIDQNGTIYQGKLGGDETLGYHAFGSANQTSIGISLIGDFTSTGPTTNAKSSLTHLMAEKAAFYGFTLKYSDGGDSKWRDPSYTVFGHKTSFRWYDSTSSWGTNITACPGNSFAPQLPGLVASAENYRQTHFTEIKNITTAVNQSFAAVHDQGVIVVKYNVAENTSPTIIEGFLPKYSGITNYIIEGNTVIISIESSIIVHPGDAGSEYLVTPMGWTGYYNEFETFSSPFVINGPEDRAKTLLKIFKLDSRVVAADVRTDLETQ